MLADIAYIFPDTLPKDETLLPLVQLFAETVYIAPVENELPNELPPLAEALLAQGLLRFHCPAPLGADRERFLRLLYDLRQRPGEYAALALADSGRDNESKNEIINAVRRHTAEGTGGAEDEEARANLLWQARLVLKLSELAERQKAEIQQSLRRIALREHELFNKLCDIDSPLCRRAIMDSPADSRRLRLRLKAWWNLAAFGSNTLLSDVFITADRDAFDAVMEQCGADLRPFLKLPLPALLADGNAAEWRNKFQRTTGELLAELRLHPACFPAKEKSWSALLEQHYPEAEHGRCRLSLHDLQNITPQELFGGRGDATKKSIVIGLLEQEKRCEIY